MQIDLSSIPTRTEHPHPIDKADIVNLLRDYSIEVTPHERLDIGRCAEILGNGRTVYITSIPGAPYEESIAMAARLRRAGLRPVPHLAARRLSSPAALVDFLTRATGEAGIDDLLIIAGDQDRPLGPYRDSLELLESGDLERFGIRRIGIAGYPGRHPKIGAEALREALLRKATLAAQAGIEARIVTQFCFEPQRILDWVQQVESWDCGLPIHIGLAGLANARTLLKFARRCGVAASLNMLRTHRKSLVNLLSISAPDETIAALAAYKAAHPSVKLAGVHFFPFGGLDQTVRWLDAIVGGDFEIQDDGRGFDVRVV